ncbi:MAG: hypothetical protein PQJ46_10280 [Spirochaetales bacterium]|nr:hypothetical protein [Spirochaetales bacterium]
MNKKLKRLYMLLSIAFVLVLSGCEFNINTATTHYYDIKAVGVSNSAYSYLDYYGYSTQTVYTGNYADSMETIVDSYPASNSNDKNYSNYTYSNVISYLDSYNLSNTIAEEAVNDKSAFYYNDVNGYYWMVIVEDVTYSGRWLKVWDNTKTVNALNLYDQGELSSN